MKIIALLFLAAAASAQQQVQVVGGPATQQVLVVSGSNIIAVCEALSTVTTGLRAATSVAISAVSKANPAVVTSTAHGFDTNSRPKVTISGATGTGWTAINATWTATIIDADTFSIPIDSSAFGTLAGTVVFTTTAPRKTMAEWSVRRLAYDGSNNLIWTGWLNGTSSMNQLCSNASSTTLNQQ
jgi:hypothetical protein